MNKRRKGKMPLALAMGVFLILGSGINLFEVNRAKAGLADHVVINEVGIYGYNGAGGGDDDWVELYNPTASDVALTGWTIQKFSEAGNLGYKQALSGTIKAGEHFLIVRQGLTTNAALLAMADLKANDDFLLAANNIIYLVNNSDTAIPATPGSNIVDYVGFGGADFSEGMSSAPGISNYKSISRVPDGEDTDNNSVDFVLLDTPTPTNSGEVEGDNGVGGTVLLTITPDANPVQNITPTGAGIVFSVNTDGVALVNYGLDATYGSATLVEEVTMNTAKTIAITGLVCGTTYHYSISAENTAGTENDSTADATFTTLPCGIVLDALVMTKSGAKANEQYTDGWAWEFDITVWDLAETTLKMKFAAWSGATALSAGNNMRFSADNGATWFDITANNDYPVLGADISAIDRDLAATGRQVKIMVQMKVPAGTPAGYYSSNYGILTE